MGAQRTKEERAEIAERAADQLRRAMEGERNAATIEITLGSSLSRAALEMALIARSNLNDGQKIMSAMSGLSIAVGILLGGLTEEDHEELLDNLKRMALVAADVSKSKRLKAQGGIN